MIISIMMITVIIMMISSTTCISTTQEALGVPASWRRDFECGSGSKEFPGFNYSVIKRPSLTEEQLSSAVITYPYFWCTFHCLVNVARHCNCLNLSSEFHHSSIIPANDQNVCRGFGGLKHQMAFLSPFFHFILLSLSLQINHHVFSASDQNVCRGCGGLHRQLASISPLFPCLISLSSGMKQIKMQNGNVKRLARVNSASVWFEFWFFFLF